MLLENLKNCGTTQSKLKVVCPIETIMFILGEVSHQLPLILAYLRIVFKIPLLLYTRYPIVASAWPSGLRLSARASKCILYITSACTRDVGVSLRIADDINIFFKA